MIDKKGNQPGHTVLQKAAQAVLMFPEDRELAREFQLQVETRRRDIVIDYWLKDLLEYVLEAASVVFRYSIWPDKVVEWLIQHTDNLDHLIDLLNHHTDCYLTIQDGGIVITTRTLETQPEILQETTSPTP